MKRKSILFFGVFAILALFGATNVVANFETCVSPECVTISGYQIRVVRDANNMFPTYDESGAVFKYQIDCHEEGPPSFNIDMLIPNCVDPGGEGGDGGGNLVTYPYLHYLWTNGSGDPSTFFGISNQLSYVLQWPGIEMAPENYFSLTVMNQKVGASPTTMEADVDGMSIGSAVILGPDCNVPPITQPKTTINTDAGTVTCTSSPDGTTFTCKDQNNNIVTPIPVQGNVDVVINKGQINEFTIHPDFISDGSQWVATGNSPCSYFTRSINNQLVLIGVGTDCIKCGPGGSCPAGKSCSTPGVSGGYCR
jgi:hypothetical protein